jgi:hypothetical protein
MVVLKPELTLPNLLPEIFYIHPTKGLVSTFPFPSPTSTNNTNKGILASFSSLLNEYKARSNRELAEQYYRKAEGDNESPEIVNSIKYWINAIVDDHDTSGLHKLADIYNYYDIVSPELFTPFNYEVINGLSRPKSVAYSLYNTIINSTHNMETVATVREKMKELQQFAKRNIFTPPVRKYNNPENFGGINALRYNDTELLEYATRVRPLTEIEAFGFVDADEFRDAVNVAIAMTNTEVETTEDAIVTPIVTPIAMDGGSQNVHDSSVVRSVTHCLKQLSGAIDRLIDAPTTVRQIREYIGERNVTDSVKLNNAIRTLDVCERNSSPLSNGYTDTNALQIVWSRINSKCNSTRIDNLKENLIDALADCVENNSVVCATGRVTHIVSALEMADVSSDPINGDADSDDTDTTTMLTIKPEWVVKVEIRDKIGKLYNDYINELSPESLKMYNSNSELPDDITKVNDINDSIKGRITTEIHKEYTDLVSVDKLNAILDNDLKAIV